MSSGLGAFGTHDVGLRRAARGDGRKIRALILRTGINPMSLEWQRFIVAEDGAGQFVGCGQVKEHRDGSRELASIAVEEAWRGRGIASRLIRELMQRHAPPLWLTCRSNLAEFYGRFGFVEVAEPAQMAPYFRKIVRLARMFHWLAPGERLAVMVWRGSA
ncbi:MAG TPA: GNAT family N-acetyltransferase [Anaerolineales bacterium]|nr:GNAT family N-acetyltransferase [Anaerolineales bacterium]